MANIQWQHQSFSPVKFDPSAGFASAADAFKGINDTIQRNKAADSLAAYRAGNLEIAQQDLDYRQGADARAIAEEERQIAKSASNFQLADEIARNAGGSRSDALFTNIRGLDNPDVQALTGLTPGQQGPMNEAGFNAFNDFVANNKAKVSDPDTYRQQVASEMAATGRFTGTEIDAKADAATQKLFPTASTDLMKMRLKALADQPGGVNGSGSGSGRGGGGSFKAWSSQPTVLQTEDIHKNFMARYSDINKQDDGYFQWDVRNPDLTGPKMRRLSTNMQKEGINPAATYAVMESHIFDGSNVLNDPDTMTPDQVETFKEEARLIMANNREGYNSKTGSSSNAAQLAAQSAAQNQQYRDDIDRVFASGTTAKYSDDELVQSFLGSIDSAPQTPTSPDNIPNQIAAPAAAGGAIMPTTPDVSDTLLGGLPSNGAGNAGGSTNFGTGNEAKISIQGGMKPTFSHGKVQATEFDGLLNSLASANNLPPELVRAVSFAESSGDPFAKSSSGALGLMQVMPATLKDPGYGIKPAANDSIEENTRVGVEYLSAMVKKFPNDIDKALASYNAGIGNVNKHNGVPPFAETQAYVPKIKGFMSQMGSADPVLQNLTNTPLAPAPQAPAPQGQIMPTAAAAPARVEGNIKGVNIDEIQDESDGAAILSGLRTGAQGYQNLSAATGRGIAGLAGGTFQGLGDMLSDVDLSDDAIIGGIRDASESAGQNIVDGIRGIPNILPRANAALQASKKRTGELSKKVGKQQADRYAKEVIKKISKNGNARGINRFHLMESLGSDLLTPEDKELVQRFLDNS